MPLGDPRVCDIAAEVVALHTLPSGSLGERISLPKCKEVRGLGGFTSLLQLLQKCVQNHLAPFSAVSHEGEVLFFEGRALLCELSAHRFVGDTLRAGVGVHVLLRVFGPDVDDHGLVCVTLEISTCCSPETSEKRSSSSNRTSLLKRS
jgi:hypothetical protein